MLKKPLAPVKHGLRTPDCVAAVGSPVLWKEIEGAGWIKPVIHRHKLKIYDAGHVAQCWARIVAGEVPNPKQSALTA